MNMYRFLCFKRYFKGFAPMRQFLILLFLAACAGTTTFSDKNLKGFVGAPDESTRQVGQDILLKGGNAADAVAAMILNETVVMPSRASLSGGGVCQIYDDKSGKVKTLDFLPVQVPQTKAGLPALPRGVFALQSQYGISRWTDVMKPAIVNAQKGVLVSDELAKDIEKAEKLPASWKVLKKGNVLQQPRLAQTLSWMSQSGTGVFYKGVWADKMAAAAFNLGYPYGTESLKTIRPQWTDSTPVLTAKGKAFFPNTPALSDKGSLVWKQITTHHDLIQVSQGKETLRQMENQVAENTFDGIGLMATDKNGLTVACAVGMGGLFGEGMYLKEQGFFLSNGLAYDHPEDIAVIIQTNPDETDVSLVLAGAGQNALVDGLRFMEAAVFGEKSVSSAVKEVRSEAAVTRDTLDEMPIFVCRNGYPNQVAACQANADVQPVYEQKAAGN